MSPNPLSHSEVAIKRAPINYPSIPHKTHHVLMGVAAGTNTDMEEARSKKEAMERTCMVAVVS